jgi:SAM-dependent methyltransferase
MSTLHTMNRLLQAYRCKDNTVARRQLRHWYNSSLGEAVADAEREQLQQVLPNLFGYHLLQLGAPMEQEMFTSSRINHRMILDDVPPLLPNTAPERSRFLSRSDRLPFPAASLDVLLLPHTMEYADNPHEVLREVERVLIPDGHVVIIGFNPWSLFGLARLVTGWRSTTLWSGHFYSAMRVRDWLTLLGFDTVVVQKYFFQPPLQHRRLLRSLVRLEQLLRRWWPLPGGGYVLVAKKREITLTPIRPRWRTQRQVLPVGAAEPSARRNHS